jgi:enoyl-CoA hydratase
MGQIIVDKVGKVATVTLDMPPVNALSQARYQELTEVFDSFGTRNDVHCVVLGARGNKAFCAGLDLKEFKEQTVERDPERALIVRATYKAVQTCAIPVIAAVDGPALGAGCALAAMCDIRIASERATFGMPEINVGRCGGGAFMGRLVPQGMLRLMYFTGEPISAWEAHRIGLVEQVVPSRKLERTAFDLAETIARKSPVGLRLAKRALNESEFLPVHEGYIVEQGYSTRLLATEDAREATRAVLEKRAPNFVGR